MCGILVLVDCSRAGCEINIILQVETLILIR